MRNPGWIVKRLYKSLFYKVLAEHNNSKDFLESMYTTVAILSIELSATDEGIMNLLQLIDGIQSTAVSSQVSTHFRFLFTQSMRFNKFRRLLTNSNLIPKTIIYFCITVFEIGEPLQPALFSHPSLSHSGYDCQHSRHRHSPRRRCQI